MSNFTFLQPEWSGLYNKVARAESRIRTEPESALRYTRLALEEAVHHLYELEYLRLPYNTSIHSLLKEPEFERLLPRNLVSGLHIVRSYGNDASHYGKRVTAGGALTSIRHLFPFLKWFAGKYSEAAPDLPGLFDERFVPDEDGELLATKEKRRRNQALLEEAITAGLALEAEVNTMRARQEELEAEARRSEAARAELENSIREQREKMAARKANRTVPVASEFTEAETRTHLIDAQLAEAGWTHLRAGYELEHKVSGMPVSKASKNGTGYVDYVLWDDDALPLALVEAKRTSASPEKGRHQAWLYANALEKAHGRRPVIYYTNGYDIYLHDDAFYSAPRRVSGFMDKDTLRWRIQQRRLRGDIRGVSPKEEIAGRSYQQEAIRRVTESFLAPSTNFAPAAAPQNTQVLNDAAPVPTTLRGSKRSALLVMATGSGKTRTAAALVDILLNHGWARRVLFLADRNALVRQAKRAFNEHLPEVSAIDLTREKEDQNTRLVFSTYPTMLNRIDASYRGAAAGAENVEKAGEGPVFGVGHFDLIIVDEAHRSVYNRYGAIFAYFDAMVVALTATPKSAIDRNTYELFGCSDDDPTFEYPLEEAVAAGYLVNYQNIDASTGFIRDGIKYHELSERDQAAYEEEFRDNVTGELPEEIAASSLNKWLFNKDTVDKVLDALMADGLKVEGGDRLGRTIVFAVNKKHAEFITERFVERYPELPSGFVSTVHNGISHSDTLIETFCNHYKELLPRVAVSVDMMDTGVDAPRVLNLVFFKVVRSYAKFWQMIGRGTRLCPDVYGPDREKTGFLIFDVCQNFDYFAVNERGREAAAPVALSTKIFTARLQLSQLLFQTGELDNAGYGRDLLDLLHGQLTELRGGEAQKRFRVRNARRHLDAYAERSRWDKLDNDDIGRLGREIAPLVLPSDDDESARRFDLLVLNLQIADLLAAARQQDKLRTGMIGIATELSKQYGIAEVMKHATLIEGLRDPDFYPGTSPRELDEVRTQLRDLLRYLKSSGQKPVYTDFGDTAPDGALSGPLTAGGSEIYRLRVEAYLRENRQHVTIRKIRNGQPITAAEMEALNELLYDRGPLESQAAFAEAYPERQLPVFVRGLLGMEESAARAALDEFIRSGNFTANQMQFLDTIVGFLTKNGVIEPKMLFEPPFTDLHDEGVVGLFDDAETRGLIGVLREVNGMVG